MDKQTYLSNKNFALQLTFKKVYLCTEQLERTVGLAQQNVLIVYMHDGTTLFCKPAFRPAQFKCV